MSKTFNKNIPYNYSGSSNVGLMFRNKVINGDMQLDVRSSGNGVGGVAGNFLTYNAQPTLFNTVDRFSISSPNVGALTAKQLTLQSSDAVSAGNLNTALAVGLVPNDSIAIYLPFDGSVNDTSGNNITATTSGTMQYATGPVCSNVTGGALYLANEANVSGGSAPTNYVTYPNFIFSSTFTVSLWALSTTAFTSTNNCLFCTNSGNTAFSNNISITFWQGRINCYFNNANSVFTTSASQNTWYHLTFTYNNGTLTLYVNGVLIGSCTGTLVQSGFMFGSFSKTNANSFAGLIDDFRIYNRILSITEITALATNVGMGITPSAASFATRLTLDNTTTDSQGGLPAPSVTGTTVYTPVSKVGTAALDVTANTSGSAPSTFLTYTLSSGSYNVPITVSAWINAASLSGIYSHPIAIGNNSGSSAWSLMLSLNYTTLGYSLQIGSTAYGVTGPTVNTGMWYHWALTAASGSYMHCYLNGILIGSVPIPTGSIGVNGGSGSPNQLTVGSKTGSSSLFSFKGFIDDVRVYNRVLSTQEIAGLYASNQHASYSILQQDIDGRNLTDFGWGTPAAQPVTASMWLKNNSPTAQQFSISANNAGSNLISWLQFENNYTDTLGFLNNLTTTGSVALTSSVVKVGGYALDLSANTLGTAGVAIVNYNVPMALQTPFTVSFWMYANNVSTVQVPFCMGPGVLYNATGSHFSTELILTASGRLYIDVMSNATTYASAASAATAITANTWHHISYTVSSNTIILYINGIAVASRADLPNNGLLTSFNNNSPNYGQTSILRLGNQLGNGSYAFKGYLDDIRIYNRVLTPSQINQLYLNNVNSTVANNYLTPRSIVYNTPSIPPNTWRKVSFTMPGDSSGNWLTTQETGLSLALALGASPLYNTTNVATASGNSNSVWNNSAEYIGSSVQQYASSGSNLLSSISNSVYVTGVQLEKGEVSTQYDTRNITSEHLIANTIVNNGAMTLMASGGNVGIGTTSPQTTLHVNGNLRGSTITFHAVSSHTAYTYGANTIVTGAAGQGWDSVIHNIGNCWNPATGYFTPTIPGYYFMSATMFLNSTDASFSIRKNATTNANGTELGGSWGRISMHGTTTIVVYLNGTTDNLSVWNTAVPAAITNNPINSITAHLIMPA